MRPIIVPGAGAKAKIRPMNSFATLSNEPHPGSLPGFSLLELMIVMALCGCLALFAADALRQWTQTEQERMVIQRFTALITRVRYLAVREGVHTGIFPLGDGSEKRLRVRLCRDGNGNGLRRREIESGVDPCETRPYDLFLDDRVFPGFLPGNIPEIPPGRGRMDKGDPIRWGSPRAIICNPWGLCTSSRTCWVAPRRPAMVCVKIIGHLGEYETWRFHSDGTWHLSPPG